jgi:hypothetical protein
MVGSGFAENRHLGEMGKEDVSGENSTTEIWLTVPDGLP